MSDIPDLVRTDLLACRNGEYILLGCRCCACGEEFFPACSGCTRCCGTRLEACELGSRGVLWSWTIQGFLPKPPYDGGEDEATFKPYGVGYVEMPSGIKIESRLTLSDPARLRIGLPMQLVLDAYRPGAHTFAFAPVDGA